MQEDMRATGEGIWIGDCRHTNVIGIQFHSVNLKADLIESVQRGSQASLSIVGSERTLLEVKALSKIS